MVEEIEVTGVAPTGARLPAGLEQRTFRLFLLELLVLIAFILGLLVLAAQSGPLLLLLTNSEGLQITGIVLTSILGIVAVFVVLAGAVAVSVLTEFWGREVVLADRSVGEALTSGYRLVRAASASLPDVAAVVRHRTAVHDPHDPSGVARAGACVAVGVSLGADVQITNSWGWAFGLACAISCADCLSRWHSSEACMRRSSRRRGRCVSRGVGRQNAGPIAGQDADPERWAG